MKTEQLIDCEGVALESEKPFAFSCCDCGLTHHMVIVSEDGKPVGFAVKRVTPLPAPAQKVVPVAEPVGLREVVAQVCEGWTLPDGARKMLETALWATPAASVPAGGEVPKGFALVPLRLTQEMDDVIAEEGWQWEDLLAAAGTITTEQYDDIAAQPILAQDAAPAVAVEAVELSNTKRKKLLNLMQKCGGRPTKRHSEDGPRLIVSADDLERFISAQSIAAPSVVQPTPVQDAKDARRQIEALMFEYRHASIGREKQTAHDKIVAAFVHLAGGAGGSVHAPGPTDAERLNFVLTHTAWVQTIELDHPGVRWQCLTQDEDENYIILSGENKSYATPREAIDAAILSSEQDQAGGGGRWV